MKRRTWPLWLLRDLPALIGIMLSFWPLMIIVIANGRKAASGRKVSATVYEHIMAMLPLAEARLRHALARQAARALGLDPRRARLETIAPPCTWAEFCPRFEEYRLAMMDLRAASQSFTDILRRQYRIRAHVDANTTRAAHGSTGALRASHHEAVSGATASRAAVSVALMVSSAQSARPSNDEGVLANARGPPLFPSWRKSAPARLSAPPRLRPHRVARTPAYAVMPPRPPFSINRYRCATVSA